MLGDGLSMQNKEGENPSETSSRQDLPVECTVTAGQSLTPDEIDILCEVGNICMGAVATTMYILLDKRVDITMPKVSLHAAREFLELYSEPFIAAEVEYVTGLSGKNLLLLMETDALLITNLLMGITFGAEAAEEFDEFRMSAISEITNQMISASATALSRIINEAVRISPPVLNRVTADTGLGGNLDAAGMMLIKISFDMEIEGLLKSKLLQLIPYDVGHDLVEKISALV